MACKSGEVNLVLLLVGSVLPRDAEKDDPRDAVQAVEDQQSQRTGTDLETVE